MNTLRDLFEDTLRDVYYAENAILKALPKMTKAAGSKKLQAIFTAHLAETKDQILRLDEVFAVLNVQPSGKECHAIKGIIQEGDDLIAEKPAQAVLDAGLLAAAQAVEHYEMARYGTLRAWADQLGYAAAAKLLEQTLSEEKSADAQLSVLALSAVNAQADSEKAGAKPDKGNSTKSDVQRERSPNHSR
jgi:ferritin-like metal-binding protein YciE